MLGALRKHAYVYAFVVFFIYSLFFISPAIYRSLVGLPVVNPATNTPIQDALRSIPFQLGLVLLLIFAVEAFGWNRKVGFRRSKQGTFRFVLIPLGIVTLALSVGVWILINQGARALFISVPLLPSLGVLLSFLLVGFTEELMFRGILFAGFRHYIGPVFTVFLTALIFGCMHFLNLFAGATVENTVPQVIHAACLGVMLGALRLMLGSILLLMLYHGIWDFLITSIGIASTSLQQPSMPITAQGLTVSPIQFIPLVYGLFVLWRYTATRRPRNQQIAKK